MTNEEYLAAFGMFYQKLIGVRKDEDYVVNSKQARRFTDVMSFLTEKAKELDGEVEPVTLIPHEEHGGITANFLVFDLHGEDIKRFCDITKHASAVTVDSTQDGVCISITIPNVFVKK